MKIEQRITLFDKTFELYISEVAIVNAIAKIADEIGRDMAGQNPLFVGILNGAFMFTSELMTRLSPAWELTFAAYSSYRGIQSGGIVHEILPIRCDTPSRPIVLLEDVIDTGLTMQQVMKRLRNEGFQDVRLATMLFKPKALKCEIIPDYIGLEVENDFIVGFGLDYNGLGRTTRNIYKLVP